MNNAQKEKLWNLIKPIRVGMFCSQDGKIIHARPMAHINDDFNGTLLYFTNLTSPKMDELGFNRNACITYSDVNNASYVSISGLCSFSSDKSLIEKHWSSFVSAWFPEGKDDPDLGVLKLHVHHAEYWDAPSNTMVRFFQVAKANLTDAQPSMGTNEKINVQRAGVVSEPT